LFSNKKKRTSRIRQNLEQRRENRTGKIMHDKLVSGILLYSYRINGQSGFHRTKDQMGFSRNKRTDRIID
jgi:hypothetical protein